MKKSVTKYRLQVPLFPVLSGFFISTLHALIENSMIIENESKWIKLKIQTINKEIMNGNKKKTKKEDREP